MSEVPVHAVLGRTDRGAPVSRQGRDPVRPAGGIVGMARTAQAAGLALVIGFDMGGTSTDVSHYAGEFERQYDTQVAGVRVRAPMLSIHRGCGRRLDPAVRRPAVPGRARVGRGRPGAGGLRPGGPLTVTDANVMLGRIQPGYFPAVFGDNGDEPLDAQ